MTSLPNPERPIDRWVHRFERAVNVTLIVLLAVVVVLSVADLAWSLVHEIRTPPRGLIPLDALFELFSGFLLVLIGTELIETLVTWGKGAAVRAEHLLLVATIALARKIVSIELGSLSGVALLGTAALLFALAAAYFLLRRTHHRAPGER